MPSLLRSSPALGWLLVLKTSWLLDLSPERSVSRGGIFDKADVIKNVLLFHFVFLLFVLLNPLAFAKPLWLIAQTETSCIHQEQWVGGFWCLAQFLGLLGPGLLQPRSLFCEASLRL